MPRTTPRPAARTKPHPPAAPARVLPDVPPPPTWGERLMPASLRNALAGLGMWHNPTPQPPSIHLLQTLAVIDHYGNCKSMSVSPTGKVCIRGAQALLLKAGYVTEPDRDQAVRYMQEVLHSAGIQMQFFAWHDLPGTTPEGIHTLMTKAAHRARANGE